MYSPMYFSKKNMTDFYLKIEICTHCYERVQFFNIFYVTYSYALFFANFLYPLLLVKIRVFLVFLLSHFLFFLIENFISDFKEDGPLPFDQLFLLLFFDPCISLVTFHYNGNNLHYILCILLDITP